MGCRQVELVLLLDRIVELTFSFHPLFFSPPPFPYLPFSRNSYNMPAAYVDKEFSDCESELQDRVSVYESEGKTMTYTQPPEPTAPAPPYTPRVPSSSNCRTYASTKLWPVRSLPLPPFSTTLTFLPVHFLLSTISGRVFLRCHLLNRRHRDCRFGRRLVRIQVLCRRCIR
jgi:hypothetical protein